MAGDKVVLEEVLKQQKQERAPTLSPDKFFEVFCVDQILKDFDLTYDSINSGIFDGPNDGGIDWAYLFVNGVIVNADEELALPPKGDLEFLLVVGQSKNEDNFKETPIDRLRSRLEILLKLDPDAKDLAAVKPELNDFFASFRDLYLKAAARFPRLEIRLYYACKGTQPEAGSKSDSLAAATVTMLADRFGKNTPISFSLLGARELLELARERPTESFTLRLSESPVSSSKAPGYIGLVRLVDFYNFLTDGKGQLRQRLFEANVRDYQGTRGSNVDIKASLEEKPAADFWWLNNGVTIIASDAKEAARNLAIQNPYIVNGLQTSNEIFRHFSAGGDKNDDRNVLVRVIVTENSEVADKIIRATNSQIYIPPSQLKATEKIHRDIEDFMKKYDLYYDRRKNHYKMQGKQISRIVGILELAQAVMAAALARPADARARPSTVLNNEADYDQVFNANYPIALYPQATLLLRRSEGYLFHPALGLPRKDQNNLRFYLMRRALIEATKKKNPGVQDLADRKDGDFGDKVMDAAFAVVVDAYTSLGGTDQVAKGVELQKAIGK